MSPILSNLDSHHLDGVLDFNPSEEIDREMEKHLASLTSLRRSKNSFAPVSRLPAEVLILIFRLLISSVRSPEPQQILIYVTHVCSAWRSIALDCTYLWSQIISFRNEAMVKAFLIRSKAAPLKILYDVYKDGPSSMENFKLVLHCLPRIRDLEILGSETWFRGERIFEIIQDALAVPAPLLEKLSLSMPVSVHHATFLPPMPFANQAPSLKHYSLERGRFIWNKDLLNGLTCLHLKDIHRKDIPNLDTLLSILKLCSRLEDLMLDDLGPFDDLDDIATEDIVELSVLRKFALVSITSDDCCRLLRSLSVRGDVECKICCFSETADDLQIPVPHFRLHNELCEKIAITINDYSIELETRTRNANGHISHSLIRVDLEERLIPLGALVSQIFVALSSVIKNCFWRDAEEISVQIRVLLFYIWHNLWERVLGCLPHLRRLTCKLPEKFYSQDTELGLMDALTPEAPHSIDAVSHLCPYLSTLELCKVDFAEHRGDFKDRLIEFLSFKKNHTQNPIAHIKLTTANALVPSTVDEIRAFVEEVEWDGVVYDDSEDGSENKSDRGEIEYEGGEEYDDENDDDGLDDEADVIRHAWRVMSALGLI